MGIQPPVDSPEGISVLSWHQTVGTVLSQIQREMGDGEMLNLRKIGAYISRLRKERDSTQMELADQLERHPPGGFQVGTGESLPDIGTLPLIAEFPNDGG